MHPGVERDEPQRVGVALGRRVTQDVDRVVEGRRRRERAAQRVDGLGHQPREREARLGAGVGGHDGGPARVRDDRKSGRCRHGLPREGLGHAEELLGVAGTQHAGGGEGRLVRGVRTRRGCPCARRRRARLLGRARFQQDDRRGADTLARRPHESRTVDDRFEVAGDHARGRVGVERVEEVGLGEVRAVAERDEPGQSTAAARPVEDGRAERPRLCDDRDRALARHDACKGGVQVVPRYDQAQAVGPEQPQTVFGRLRDYRMLQGDARGARLLETGGQHDGGGDSGDAAGLDDRRHERRAGTATTTRSGTPGSEAISAKQGCPATSSA